jgi:Fe-S-cluster containining protein
MTERTCGTCSLCCKLAYIPELNKSIDSWCRHARPGVGGCSIYLDRPPSCRDFNCGWLVGARELGDEWFPARCKMIVTRREPRSNLTERGMLVTVDPTYPNAWRRKPYYVQLLGWAQHMVVEIRVGRRCIRLNADGTEQQETRTQAWLEDREEPCPVISN